MIGAGGTGAGGIGAGGTGAGGTGAGGTGAKGTGAGGTGAKGTGERGNRRGNPAREVRVGGGEGQARRRMSVVAISGMKTSAS
jgi:hypothetical protein